MICRSGKLAFATERSALIRCQRARGEGLQLRTYWCAGCGFWHLTTVRDR